MPGVGRSRQRLEDAEAAPCLKGGASARRFLGALGSCLTTEGKGPRGEGVFEGSLAGRESKRPPKPGLREEEEVLEAF